MKAKRNKLSVFLPPPVHQKVIAAAKRETERRKKKGERRPVISNSTFIAELVAQHFAQ